MAVSATIIFIERCLNIIHILLSVLTLLVAVFLCHQFTKPKSIFRSAYFVILTYSYILDTIFSIAWIYGHWIEYDTRNSFIVVILPIQWHAMYILGLLDAILGFNRCTALGFSMWHKKVSVTKFLNFFRTCFQTKSDIAKMIETFLEAFGQSFSCYANFFRRRQRKSL